MLLTDIIDMYTIRWYHWLIFRIFRKLWTPILVNRPALIVIMKDWLSIWLDNIHQHSNTEK
jgi:hypothetical protein